MSATIYAVCNRCGHTEPRPAHAADDWSGCENCPAPAREVESFDDPDIAEDASEIVLANNADHMAMLRSGGDALIDARYA
jgi:hypothetical protein